MTQDDNDRTVAVVVCNWVVVVLAIPFPLQFAMSGLKGWNELKCQWNDLPAFAITIAKIPILDN